MWTFLFVLAIGIIAALLAWDYRRKAQQREAASQERFAKMFEGASPMLAAGGAADGAAAPVPPAALATAPVASRRFLGQAETLVYLLLRASLPEYSIFARVPVTAVLGNPHALRAARALVDLIVCDRNMQIVAAVELREAKAGARSDAAVFREAGVRLVELDPRALPKRPEVRGLVLGEEKPSA